MLPLQQLKLKSKRLRLVRGFTLMEILVVMSLSIILLAGLYGVYMTSYQSYRHNTDRAELDQNARIALERITRDLRQTNDVVTALPPTDTDVLNPAPSNLMFLDGHNTDKIQYIEYSLSNGNLSRKVEHFYYPIDPNTWVSYNGNPAPQESIDENVVKADEVQSLEFYGSAALINIKIVVSNGSSQITYQTQTLGRNVQ